MATWLITYLFVSYQSPELDQGQGGCFVRYFVLAPRTMPSMQRFVAWIGWMNEWMSADTSLRRAWDCGRLALGSPSMVFPLFPSHHPHLFLTRKGPGSDRPGLAASRKILLKPPHCAGFFIKVQPASFGFSCLPGALHRNQRGGVVWGFLVGCVFRRKNPVG